jgi:predicted enzyme related to lactoylglutathione lyase
VKRYRFRGEFPAEPHRNRLSVLLGRAEHELSSRTIGVLAEPVTMSGSKQPTRANGKICYLEIPTFDIARSASFYGAVFGWNIRTDSDGSASFDDTVGEVSGTWVLGRKPMTEPGVLISIMVNSIADTAPLITAHGGMILQPEAEFAPDQRTLLFSDPAGNVFCLYQSGRSSDS